MSFFLKSLVIAGFFGGSFNSARAVDWSEVYQNKVNSIAVVAGPGVCSGSLVGEKLVLTAWHCVSHLRQVMVLMKNPEEKVEAWVIAKDRDRDVALLRLARDFSGRKPLALQIAPIREGEPVATIGHPLALRGTLLGGILLNDRSFMISTGVVSKVNKDNIVSDLSVSPGNSGGPLLNSKGEIVGVVSSKLVGMGAGQVGFFAPAETVEKLMEKKEREEPISWLYASHRSGLLLTRLNDSLRRQGELSESHWGLEFALELWDRWRWSYGWTRPGASERLNYWRTGYSHALGGADFRSLRVDLGVGMNYYRFLRRENLNSPVVAFGMELRSLRVEWGRRLDSKNQGDYVLFGLRLGR